MKSHVLKEVAIPSDDMSDLIFYLTVEGGLYRKHKPHGHKGGLYVEISFKDDFKCSRFEQARDLLPASGSHFGE